VDAHKRNSSVESTHLLRVANQLRKCRLRFERQRVHDWRRAAYLRYRAVEPVDKRRRDNGRPRVGVGRYKSERGIWGSDKSLHSAFTLVMSTPGVLGRATRTPTRSLARTTRTPTRSTSRRPITPGVDEMLEAEPFTMPARMQCYPRAAVVREKKHRIQKESKASSLQGRPATLTASRSVLRESSSTRRSRSLGVSSSIRFTRPSADGRCCACRAVMQPAMTPTARRS
jgi:hypothetical protein